MLYVHQTAARRTSPNDRPQANHRLTTDEPKNTKHRCTCRQKFIAGVMIMLVDWLFIPARANSSYLATVYRRFSVGRLTDALFDLSVRYYNDVIRCRSCSCYSPRQKFTATSVVRTMTRQSFIRLDFVFTRTNWVGMAS